MLIVAKPGHEKQVVDIFRKWDLDVATIGRVIAAPRLRVFHHGELVADIPNKALTDEAPRYQRPMAATATCPTEDVTPKLISNLKSQISNLKSEAATFTEILRRLLAAPNIASKQWVYRQYDHMVRTNTVVLPGSDAAVLRVKETRRSLAMSLDCNGRYCAINPYEGARLAVAEAARNVVCSGAQPLAITNCLNFASPERPEVMRAFSDTVDGIGEVCRALRTPVTGGNVSFYNETEGRGVYPTPVIGMLGVIENARHVTAQWFKTAGDVILLLGKTNDDLGASELAASWVSEAVGRVPQLDLALEQSVQQVCLQAIQAGLARSAHDCAEGGLSVALAESCFSHYRKAAIGAQIDLTEHLGLSGARELTEVEASKLALLFAESPSRIILSVAPEHTEQAKSLAAQAGVPCATIGTVGGERLQIVCDGAPLIDEAVARLEEGWRATLSRALDRPLQVAAD
jgi:phosphoribosylformylglycinamidine synthase